MKSALEILRLHDKFSSFSGQMSNEVKCETAGHGVKKGVKVVLCVMKTRDLTKNFSEFIILITKNLKMKINFKNHIKKLKTVLKSGG